MNVVLPEEVSKKVYRDGFFEAGLTTAFIQYIKPGMTVIDIGAHYGYFSLLAARLANQNGQVYAFEPAKTTFDILSQNLNGFSKVHLLQKAVFSSSLSIVLRDYGPAWSSFNSFTDPRDFKAHGLAFKENIVDAVILDEFVKHQALRPEFIKIDAESAEMEILKGMEYILREIKPILSIEVGDEVSIENIPTSRSLIAYVEANGYQAFSFDGVGFVRHNLREQYAYDNIIFLPVTA